MTVTGPDFIALQVSDLERSAILRERPGTALRPGPPPGTVLHHNADPFAVPPLPGS